MGTGFLRTQTSSSPKPFLITWQPLPIAKFAIEWWPRYRLRGAVRGDATASISVKAA